MIKVGGTVEVRCLPKILRQQKDDLQISEACRRMGKFWTRLRASQLGISVQYICECGSIHLERTSRNFPLQLSYRLAPQSTPPAPPMYAPATRAYSNGQMQPGNALERHGIPPRHSTGTMQPSNRRVNYLYGLDPKASALHSPTIQEGNRIEG
jgi:hypothetical protein